MARRNLFRTFASVMGLLGLWATQATAADIPFVVTMNEAVRVTGTPQIAIDVGGVPRVATYRSGTGTDTLTFAYTVQPGDFDADGITILTPQIQLNGGTIRDAAGNDAVLTFTAPSTANLKVQTYTPLFTSAISNANASSVSFTISNLPTLPPNSYSYRYTVSGANGGSISGGPTAFSGSSVTVTGLDLSAFPASDVTLSVTVTGPSGQGQSKAITVTPAFSGVLDGFTPAATAAYSTRRLRNAYTGPLLRVRRSTDGNLLDVSGNTIGGSLDTAALASFCASASCFVATWYDQSGNNRHVSQATGASQPRIVNAGTVDSANGRPSLRFLAGTLMTSSTAATWLNGGAYGINAVSQLAAAPGFNIMVTTGTCCSNSTLQFGWKNDGTFLFGHYGNDAEFIFPPSLNLQVYSGDKANGAGSAAWINGSTIGTSASPTSNLATSAPLRLGGGIINIYDASWNGWISEVMTFGAQLGSSRTALEANQKAWYGTP